MVSSWTGFVPKTLKRLLKQPNAYVFLRKCKRHIALSPSALSDIKAAIRAHLNRLVTRFDAELDAVVIGFQNINVLTNLGAILNDSPHIHIDIEAEFYVFKPEKGSVLSGVVKKKSRDNIGCLVHDIFNASIPLDLEDKIDVDDIGIGEPLTFRVEEVDFSESLPYIKGKLVVTQEEMTSKQVAKDVKRKRSDDHLLRKKIKTEVHNSSMEEENSPSNFKLNNDFKLPTSILKKNSSMAIEGSPARRISFYGDVPSTSNEIVDFRENANEDLPLKEKRKKKKKKESENVSVEQSANHSKKVKKSASVIGIELLEDEDDFEESERHNLSLPTELKTKKKKKTKKMREQEHEIWNPEHKEHTVGDSNESPKKKKKKNRDMLETEIPDFEEIVGDTSDTSDPSEQKSKSKKKKKKESLQKEQREFETKKKKSTIEPEAGIGAPEEPYLDQEQFSEFPVRQKVKKKKKETIPCEEMSETSEVKEHQKSKKKVKNFIENIPLKTEEGDSCAIKMNESTSGKQKTGKGRKKQPNVREPVNSSEISGREEQDTNDSSASEAKKKKTKKWKNNITNVDKISKGRKEKDVLSTEPIHVHVSQEEHKKEDVHSSKSTSHLAPDNAKIKKKKNTLSGFKPDSIANSTVMASAERLKKKRKHSDGSDVSFDFLSPIKKSSRPSNIHEDDLRFDSSPQIETNPKTKIALPSRKAKSSLSNSPKPKIQVSSAVPITLDSLSPIKNTGGSPDNYEDNFGFITSTQIETVPQTKSIPSNIKRASKSPSKSPMRKSSVSSTDDRVPPNSERGKQKSFKSPPPRSSGSSKKSSISKQILKDTDNRESPSSTVDSVKTMSVGSKKVDKKGTEMSKLPHQLHTSVDSDSSSGSSSSSSSMDLPDPKSLRKANESLNKTVDKVTTQEESKSALLKPGGSDSSSSDSDAPPPDLISALQLTKKKPIAQKTPPKSVVQKPVESDESSTDLDVPVEKAEREGLQQPAEQLEKILPTKSLSRDSESDVDSTDSDLPSHMQKVYKKNLPVNTAQTTVTPQTSVSLPVKTLSSENKIPSSSLTSVAIENQQKDENSSAPEKDNKEESSDDSLKKIQISSLYAKTPPKKAQSRKSKSDDYDLRSLPLPKPIKKKSRAEKKRNNSEKSVDSDVGSLRHAKLKKSTKSKPTIKMENKKQDSDLNLPKPVSSNSESENELTSPAQATMPATNPGKKTAPPLKRTKLQSESDGSKIGESNADSLVKGMPPKIEPEKVAPSLKEKKQKNVIKTSKNNSKERDVSSTESKAGAKESDTYKEVSVLPLNPDALAALAEELLKKVK